MPYVEGDDLHPKANVEKMAAGIPLTDADREPWLKFIRKTAEKHTIEDKYDQASEESSGKHCRGVVIGCSALKRYYRDILRGRPKPVPKIPTTVIVDQEHGLAEPMESPQPEALPTYFVFIKGDRQLILGRMEKRAGHYMKAGMLDSQLNTLESPEGEEGVVVVDAEDRTEEQVNKAKEGIVKFTGEWFLKFVNELSD